MPTDPENLVYHRQTLLEHLSCRPSLHLANNLVRLAQTLYHLHTLLTPTNSVVAFFQKIVKLSSTVHVLKQFSLHLIFSEPGT